MTLSTPSYIQQANIQDPTIRYLWDDWNVEQAETPIDKKLKAQLKKVSLRSSIAFSIATAEWITFSFEQFIDDPVPLQYLEAAWSQSINFNYGFIWWDPLADEDWQ